MNQPKNLIEINDGVAQITIFKVNGDTVVTMLDEADLPLVHGRNLFAIPARNSSRKIYYIMYWDKQLKKPLYLHKLLLEVPAGMEVDHIDRDPQNNRRFNLRPATKNQNAVNKPSKKNKTGFRGVREDHRCKKPRFDALCAGVYVGRFNSAEAAARAFDEAAIKRFGPKFPMLNFPEEAV